MKEIYFRDMHVERTYKNLELVRYEPDSVYRIENIEAALSSRTLSDAEALEILDEPKVMNKYMLYRWIPAHDLNKTADKAMKKDN